jgi:hypothetical protein
MRLIRNVYFIKFIEICNLNQFAISINLQSPLQGMISN